jgi:basic membrane protein A
MNPRTQEERHILERVSVKTTAASIFVLILAVSLSACGGSTPEPTQMPTAQPTENVMIGEGVQICQVTDTMGTADNSTNEQIWRGIDKAQSQFGIEGVVTESQSPSEYESNLATMVQGNCGLIIVAGPELGPIAFELAQTNSDQLFLVFNSEPDADLNNVMAVEFRADQAAFLAGFLAAGVTDTGKVGAFGGTEDANTLSVLKGFGEGVDFYNQEHDTSILLFGWDPGSQTGDFLGSNDDEAGVEDMVQSYLNEGIDIVLPAAGHAGFAALGPILSHGEAYAIGLNSDWSREASDYADVILTSIVTNADEITLEVIQSVLEGSFSGGVTQASIADGAVELGTIFVQEPASSADVMTWFEDLEIEVKEVERGLKSGEIQVP